MRNFIKTTMVLSLAFVNVFIANAQQGDANSNIEILHEVVEGKLSHLKAKSGNIEVIFRDDRLEIFENTNSNNTEKQSFLFFDNAEKVSPKPIGLISTSMTAIKNPSISKVLGVSDIEVNRYESVVYENLYKGLDLKVELNDSGLLFTIINKSGMSSIPFSLSSWNETDLVKIDNSIKHVNHDNIEISFPKDEMNIEGRALSFNNDISKEVSKNLSFTLNFLN